MAAGSSTRSKTKQQRSNTAAQLRAEQMRKRQFRTVIFFALSVFLTALAFIEGQNVWRFLHEVIFGMTGILAYCVGLILLVITLMAAYSKKPKGIQVFFIILLTLSLCGAFLIFGNINIEKFNLTDGILRLYNEGTKKHGGGLLSAVLGWPLYVIFGSTGAGITIVLVIFISVMAVMGKGLFDLVEAIRRPVSETINKKREEKELLDEFREELEPKQEIKQPKQRIDIPLMPKKTKIDVRIPPKKSGIDLPLGPPPEESVWVPGPGDADTPILEAKQPLETVDVNVVEDSSAKGKNEVVISLFEEYEQGEKQQNELFARFSSDIAIEDNTDEDSIIKSEPSSFEGDEIEEKPKIIKKPTKRRIPYRTPPLSLLISEDTPLGGDIREELRENGEFLVKVLQSYGVQTKVVDISRGPTVTRYELQPSAGVRLSKITNLEKEIALNLATAGVRIVAPIPNKAAVGIEVPNSHKRIVRLSSAISSTEFRRSESPLTVALGRDISGKIMVTDIARMPHLLIAGTTGSGKSNCLHSMIISMMFKTSPQDLKFVFIDPKLVEFGVYDGMPHMLVPVVTDPRKASGALAWAVGEMLKRYRLFSEHKVRDISSFNRIIENGDATPLTQDEETVTVEKLPRIVVIVDELADLMLVAPREVEDSICRLAQMARAAGIHLIIATQRPSVDVITGVIKANISSRIALSVVSQVDSRTIIDTAGAENLLGGGDMLFLPLELPKPVRIQGCYVSDEEIEKVVAYLKENAIIEYNEDVLEEIERQAAKEKGSVTGGSSQKDDRDSMLDAAIEIVVEAGQASTSFLQRRLKLGFSRAGRIMDEMEAMGIIGPPDGSKPRVVNMTMQQLRERQLKMDEFQD